MAMSEKQQALCKGHGFDFSGLSAIFINCTLKPSGTLSHTEALIHVSKEIMEANGIRTELLRPVDLELPPGVYPDMTEHGFDRDAWPQLFRRVMDASILVIGTPIWLGEESSVCRRVIERLYGESGRLNDRGHLSSDTQSCALRRHPVLRRLCCDS